MFWREKKPSSGVRYKEQSSEPSKTLATDRRVKVLIAGEALEKRPLRVTLEADGYVRPSRSQ